MKSTLNILFAFGFLLSSTSKIFSQSIDVNDSLALVDLYNNTNGPNWTNHSKWLTATPVASWNGITVTGNRVTRIFLRQNNLNGKIPSSIGNLTGLMNLYMDFNQLYDTIPSTIGNLVNLTVLNLYGNKQLTGNIPRSLKNLVNLQTLMLGYNQLSGTIPSSLSNLSELEVLDLSSNNLIGNIPSSFGKLIKLISLTLGANQLTGNIPDSLKYLSNLSTLELFGNHLSGNIPTWLGDLRKMYSLRLAGNQLSGGIPASLGNLPILNSLWLHENLLTGTIPASLGNLSNLTELYLNNNQLGDSIPASLGNLYNLNYLDLSHNALSGNIPSSVGRLLKLYSLILDDNQLTGSIPDALDKLSNLERMDLQNNQLTGNIPDFIGDLSPILTATLNNNKLSGKLPSSLSQVGGYLSIRDNEFTFAGMEEAIKPRTNQNTAYAPQATISLNRNNNVLWVSAGGTPSNDTFRLYKNGILVTTQIADSSFKITATGQYNITANNAIATQLTLYSDTTTISTFLADTTTKVVQNVTGPSSVDINNGIYKLVTLTPTEGANALNGNVTTTVTIDTAVKVYNNQPYVQRYYDIVPATNPSTSQATVTLYFTQLEFDDFNSYVTTNHLNIPLLPTNGVNNGNVRIIQLHGTFTGSSDPGNYSDSTTVLITPTVAWDNTDQWWVITFPVIGFSGFYLSTGNFTLPITLTFFTASKNKTSVVLNWRTANEQNNKYFAIERSNNSNNSFKEIGRVNSKGNSNQTQQYLFEDFNPLSGGNYYRLKQVDKDGKTTYSKVVFIDFGKLIAIKLYPNPVKDVLTLEGLDANIVTKISITSLQGSVLAKTTTTNSTYTWNIKQLPAGTYYVRIEAGKSVSTLRFVKG